MHPHLKSTIAVMFTVLGMVESCAQIISPPAMTIIPAAEAVRYPDLWPVAVPSELPPAPEMDLFEERATPTRTIDTFSIGNTQTPSPGYTGDFGGPAIPPLIDAISSFSAPNVQVVPEPGSLGLIIVGVSGLFIARRRFNRRK